jgi:hypothetical protein
MLFHGTWEIVWVGVGVRIWSIMCMGTGVVVISAFCTMILQDGVFIITSMSTDTSIIVAMCCIHFLYFV